jgi:aspartyl-tRNA(Asn)/glutamyl-tRNA(Gln) amidotransferase subunit B
MKKIHMLVCYLGICDGNMQEGSFRCDANVSVRPKGQLAFGTRTEIKNLNSFRFVERALEFEVQRQIDLLEDGGRVVQETRLYAPDKGETRPMRSKEEANDYRYFPDPDLLPLVLTEEFIEAARRTLPELPDAKKQRFMEHYGLSAYDADVLTASRDLADYYEALVKEVGGQTKLCANWVMGDLLGFLNKENKDITVSPVSPERLAGLLRRIQDQTVSGKIAKEVFEALWNSQGDADTIIEQRGLKQITDTTVLEEVIDEVIRANPEQLAQYRAGKDKLLGFFVGQVMKASKGKANPQQVNELLVKKLNG